jgi:catechol 2,3-dioxygenase-like lactoylglutathione lyase family enzyme
MPANPDGEIREGVSNMRCQYHHLHLICSNLDRTERFFTEIFGAKLVQRRRFGTADGAVLDLNGTTINLRVSREEDLITDDSSNVRYGYDHLGLEVEDLDAAWKELKDQGYALISPPRIVGKVKFAFFKGPDNITIELIQSLS